MTADLLDPHGHHRTAEYVCQQCQTHFKVWGRPEVADSCPICGDDPGAPEVVA